jgi:L-seryl-tRNA(Ser) seleniumtransferase
MEGNAQERRGMAALPSVDRLLKAPVLTVLIERHGRAPVADAVRSELSSVRSAIASGNSAVQTADVLVQNIASRVERAMAPTLRPVFNLTGTVLHTNLGRAPLPEEALHAIAAVSRGASNLEFDLATGKRGDRDAHLESLLSKLTGAEAATVVNNNAAAVLLTLASIAPRKEVIVSRGELIEIGGAFRMPDIMQRAGCRLREVGTTNRTHEKDYRDAISPRTGALMSVHASNYSVQGFTASVDEAKIALIAHDARLPYLVDLGAGALVDFRPYGLPHEPTVAETVSAGADIVTFSGDKLLGGPQCGLIAGRADLIDKIKRNPLKRALRCDKMTIAALESVLRLHLDPDRLAERLPTLALLSRKQPEIREVAGRVLLAMQTALGDAAQASIEDCMSQIGSGSLPVETLPSAAIVLRQPKRKASSGAWLSAISTAFRSLPVPVIGRVEKDAFWLDMRCLTDEGSFLSQLERLKPVL